jgi:antitoxin MazE
MITTLKKWGNSQGLRVSKELMKILGLDNLEQEIQIEVENHKITIEKVDKEVTLDSLFANYDGDYKPSEYDWGKPKGREIW